MIYLGICSATNYTSVAISRDSQLLGEINLKLLSAERIVPTIEDLTRLLNVNLEAVVVAQGPGSYSGLRGSLAIAKTLSLSLKIPLWAVSTLEIIAYSLCFINSTIISTFKACKDEYNIAIFSCWGKKLQRLSDDQIIKRDQLIKFLNKFQGTPYLVGEIEEELINRIPNNVIFIERFPRGIDAIKHLINSPDLKPKDPLTLQPIYSHQPNIREFKS